MNDPIDQVINILRLRLIAHKHGDPTGLLRREADRIEALHASTRLETAHV